MSLIQALAMLAVAASAGAAAVAFVTSRRARVTETRDPDPEAVMAGTAVVVLLMLLDERRVLRWDYGVDAAAGRAPLPGAGLLLGLTLLTALAGTLLLGAGRYSGRPPRRVDPRVAGRRLLILGAGLCVLAAGVIAWDAARLGANVLTAAAPDVAAIVLAAVWVAWAIALLLRPATGRDPRALAERSRRQTAVAAALAIVAVAMTGLESWLRLGSYASPPMAAAAAAALVGVVAVQPTRFASAGRGLLAAALLLLLLAPPR